jgi:hypothetical protein
LRFIFTLEQVLLFFVQKLWSWSLYFKGWWVRNSGQIGKPQEYFSSISKLLFADSYLSLRAVLVLRRISHRDQNICRNFCRLSSLAQSRFPILVNGKCSKMLLSPSFTLISTRDFLVDSSGTMKSSQKFLLFKVQTSDFTARKCGKWSLNELGFYFLLKSELKAEKLFVFVFI